ncbi:MAG: hypothetical protein ACP5NQ_07280, partial [Vulcanisaeta sp.]
MNTSMAWNSRYTLALLVIILALLIIVIALYLDPLRANTDSILAQETAMQEEYLSPINSTITVILNITETAIKDLSAVMGNTAKIYYYQRVNASNIISAINHTNTNIINALSETNSSIINAISNAQSNIENNVESNVTTTVDNVGDAIYSAVENVSNYVVNNDTKIIQLLKKILSKATMYYQLYGAPYTTIGQTYTLFSFSNLTLVQVLLINLSVPSGGNVTIYCYTVPGTQISIPIYTTT